MDALSCFHDWIDQRGDVHTADEMPEYQRIEQLPSIQPDASENTCEIERKSNDCISRQDAIEHLVDNVSWFDEDGCEADEDEKRYIIEGLINAVPSAEPESEPVGCSGCRYERFGNRVCDACSRFYADRYDAERRTDE